MSSKAPTDRQRRVRLVNLRTGRTVVETVRRTRTLLELLTGLTVRPKLRAGEALWLEPCGGIHTFGMRYAIGVVLLDARLEVLGVYPRVRPCRVVLPRHGARIALELLPEDLVAADLRVGDELALITASAND